LGWRGKRLRSLGRLRLERRRHRIPPNRKPNSCKLCLLRVWDGNSSWGSLNLGRSNKVLQEIVDLETNSLDSTVREVDFAGLIAVFPDISPRVKDRGSKL
jgi:hypothetical protein